MPEFLNQVEEDFERAIEDRDYEAAKELQRLRDWMAYDKDISWMPILETL